MPTILSIEYNIVVGSIIIKKLHYYWKGTCEFAK